MTHRAEAAPADSPPTNSHSPDTPSPDALHHTVHMAWSSPKPRARAAIPNRFDFETTRSWAIFAAPAIAAYAISGALGWPMAAAWFNALLLGWLAAVISRWFFNRRTPKLPPETARAIALNADKRYRLRLIGDPRRTRVVNQPSAESPEPESSEPLVFRVLFGLPDWPRFFRFFVPIVFGCGIFALLEAALPRIVIPLIQIRAIVAGIAAGLALMFCWPNYFRLAPGRLDIFRYRFLGRSPPLVRTFDLANSRVLVDTDEKCVLIESPGTEPEKIPYCAVPNHLGFARATLEAARSQRPCPPLPVDTLIG